MLPSVKVPVALSFWVVPKANEGFTGVIAMETRVGCATLRVLEPVTGPKVAVIVALPVPTPVAKPVLLTLATAGADVLYVTEFVRFCVLPSVFVTAAANCCVLPRATDAA